MILASKFKVEDLFENRFNVDFIQATLTQRVEASPSLYSGSANVTLDSEGHLRLKLYHRSHDIESLLSDFGKDINSPGLVPGTLITDEHYYDFEGIDSAGNIWHATRLSLSQDVSIPTGGIVITAKLRSIELTQNPILKSASARAYFSSEYNIPLFHAESQGVMTGFRSVELEINNKKIVIKRFPTFYEIEADLTNVEKPETHFEIILEALGIGLGRHLISKVRCLSTIASSKVEIFSYPTSQSVLSIQPPFKISHQIPLNNFSNFVGSYINTITKENDSLAGYWARVINAFQCNVEIMALALTTAIEGVLVEYYKASVEGDQEFISQLEEAYQVINENVKGERAKNFLTQALSGAKATKAKDILFALVGKGCITKEQVELWVSLRNKSAHAAKLKLGDQDIQKYMNQLYGCLELFYRLILGRISFSGDIRMYSLAGWPVGQVQFDYEKLLMPPA